MKRSVKTALVSAAAALGLLGSIAGTQPAAAEEKYKFFYSASYYGNDWQAEATNMIKAMAAYYSDKIDLKVKVAGANAQRQIQQINAMIQAGADAIIVYPISPTALNKVAKTACDKGVVVISYDSEITEPCTYVAKVDAVDLGRTRAQWLADELGGKGNIVVITGVAGTSFNEDVIKGQNEVFAKYPDINILAEVDGEWEHAGAKLRLSEILATRTWDDIDGLIVQTGCLVATTMQIDAGIPPEKIRPCAGETSNGHRIQMLPAGSVEGAVGLRSLSNGSAPWGGAYAVKLALKKLEGEDISPRWHKLDPNPVVTGNVKLCETGSQEELLAGCHVVNPEIVPDTWYADFWSPWVPEIGLDAALVGDPEPK